MKSRDAQNNTASEFPNACTGVRWRQPNATCPNMQPEETGPAS